MFEDADEDDNDLFSGSGALFGKTGGLFDAPKGGKRLMLTLLQFCVIRN